MNKLFRPALTLFLLLSVITGLIYPLVVTVIARVAFPYQAAGSLIERKAPGAGPASFVGSELIGQSFTQPRYFWGRASATSPMGYNGGLSSGSNLGPTNPALADAVKARVQTLRAADPGNTAPVPIDLVTTSASGLDPHISPAAAEWQLTRVAKARGLSVQQLRAVVVRHTEGRQLGFFGEPRVNVLMLNLDLDAMTPL